MAAKSAIAVKKPRELTEEEILKAPDKDYMNDMVKDHQKDLAVFQNEAKNGSDADVKAFASKTSAVVEKHLDMVKAAQGKLK